MSARLNKTECKILAILQTRKRYCAMTFAGRGAGGGLVKGGARERDAAAGLVAKGLATVIKLDNHRVVTGNGNMIHCYEVVIGLVVQT